MFSYAVSKLCKGNTYAKAQDPGKKNHSVQQGKGLEDHCERRKPAALHGWRDNDPEDGGVFRRAGRFQVYCAGGTVEARSFQSYGDHGDNCCNPLDFHVYLLLFAEQNSGINKFKTPLESCQSGRSCSTRNAVPVKGPGFESLTLRQNKIVPAGYYFILRKKSIAVLRFLEYRSFQDLNI